MESTGGRRLIESRLFASCETLPHFRRDQSLITERLPDCTNLLFSQSERRYRYHRTGNCAPLEIPNEGVLSGTKAERYVEARIHGLTQAIAMRSSPPNLLCTISTEWILERPRSATRSNTRGRLTGHTQPMTPRPNLNYSSWLGFSS